MSSIAREIARLGGEGILTADDLPDLKAASRRVLKLLGDHQWHHPDEIMRAAGTGNTPAREGLRRMRELRPYYHIERKRLEGSRLFLYRLAPPPRPLQAALF